MILMENESLALGQRWTVRWKPTVPIEHPPSPRLLSHIGKMDTDPNPSGHRQPTLSLSEQGTTDDPQVWTRQA